MTAKPGGDSHETARAPDTEEEWQLFKLTMDAEIRNEVAGKRAPGGSGRTWNERWIKSIEALEGTHENPGKYVSYIVEQRRRNGLPELQREPPR